MSKFIQNNFQKINNLPFVSVLMTAYNREKYIVEAIESVLASTYINFELIILDDCSTDNTFAIASTYLEKDSRIRLYKNDYNLGQFANRNKAIEISKGHYVKFLDSDDMLMPNGLEVMVNSMIAFPDSGLGVPTRRIIDNDLPYQLTAYESVAQHYKGENHLCYGPTGTIFLRDALLKAGLFEEKYGILTDTLLNIKIASIYPTVFFKKDLFFWRTHEEQVTNEQEDDVKMIGERDRIMKAAMAYQFLPLSEKETNLILNNFSKINAKHFLRYILKWRFKDAFQIKRDTNLNLKNLFISFF